jgi:hypothetical protein
MARMISISVCRKRLAILWFAGGLALFLLVVFQSILGKYGAKVEEAWAWFLPTIMPTLMLIVGVLVLHATARGDNDKQVECFIFWLAFLLSAIYLVLVGLVPLIQPFTSSSTLELMKRSGLWLGPFQGLVAAVLAVFFVRAEQS